MGTLKDHPIDRAGDLKHRPISGGAPKNAFFISMQNSFKENVRQQLLVAAQEYFALLMHFIPSILLTSMLSRQWGAAIIF